MSCEHSVARFVTETRLEAVPGDAQEVVKHILLTVLGTAIAGAHEAGVREALSVYGDAAPARSAATVLVYGQRLPVANAATLNGLMCRALDYCDAMAPGLHIGSSLVPAALAAAELRGGCSGAEFLEALVVGAELGSRMNLGEAAYAGLDPTGIAGVFASTAAVARVLRLSVDQTWHALALAFNRCGGSFQSNIDGSLAVRAIQGWVAGDGVTCARLAQASITGPRQFVSGVYGYGQLYAKDAGFAAQLLDGLGSEYRLLDTMFKKYPSCGLTQGVTELTLRLLRETALSADEVEQIHVRLPPYAHKLVGHPFVVGDNPRVNAQFSAQYCVANAVIRRASKLDHFTPEHVVDLSLANMIRRVSVEADPDMASRDHTAVDIEVHCRGAVKHAASLEIAPGFPGNALCKQEHTERLSACLEYSSAGWSPVGQRQLIRSAMSIELLPDVRELIALISKPVNPTKSQSLGLSSVGTGPFKNQH